MSYDIYLIARRPDQNWEQAWQAHQELDDVDTVGTATWWVPVEGALLGRFPSWRALRVSDAVELNDLERGIQVRLSEHSAFVSVAFWEALDGVDPMDLALEAVRIIEALTGLFGFDPQTMSPTSDDRGRAAMLRQSTTDWISTTLEADEDTLSRTVNNGS
jgi:hypothetical protein